MDMKKRRIAAGLLAGVLVIGGQQVWAATTHYNDSSVTGGSEQWQKWVADWNQTATDFTKVSLTPGGAASELNFAWYSEETSQHLLFILEQIRMILKPVQELQAV